MPDALPISVFISYAHKDEPLTKRFLAHLAALKREGLIGVWYDRELRPGQHLDSSIESELAAADVVILLVSPDFINSDYCNEKEMRRAFARAQAGRCKVVAVILKPCQWENIPIDDEGWRLGEFVALPKDGKPVTQWRSRDAAWDSVVDSIRGLILDKSAPGTKPRKGNDGSQLGDVVFPPTVQPEYDVWLADAIWRVFLRTWDLLPHEVRNPVEEVEHQRLHLVTKEFREAAYEGRLPIWGKRGNSEQWEAIHQDYWRHRQISYTSIINAHPSTLSVEIAGTFVASDEWREFMTARSAVDAIWPVR